MRFFLYLAFLFFSTQSALAFDELFSVPRKTEFQTLLEKQEHGNAEEPAKSLLEQAQEKLSHFYKNCLKQKQIALSEENLSHLCACTAVNIHDKFEAADILKMFEQPPRGSKQREQSLYRAFSPCAVEPIHNSVLDSCFSNPALEKKLKNQDKVCHCLADGVRAYFGNDTDLYTRAYLKYNDARHQDPLSWYFDDLSFQNHNEEWLTQCLYWHESR